MLGFKKIGETDGQAQSFLRDATVQGDVPPYDNRGTFINRMVNVSQCLLLWIKMNITQRVNIQMHWHNLIKQWSCCNEDITTESKI